MCNVWDGTRARQYVAQLLLMMKLILVLAVHFLH